MRKLANKRVANYHAKLKEHYANYPIKDNARASDNIKIVKNALVAIKNTSRGAW